MGHRLAKKLQEKVVEDYDTIAGEFSSTRQRAWKEFELLLPYLKKGAKIADIGCGNGRLLDFLNAHPESSYTGVDISTKLLQEARMRHPEAHFLEGNMIDLPLHSGEFQSAAVIASLHHLPSPYLRKKALQEVHRILAPKGVALFTVWQLRQKKYRIPAIKAWLRSIITLGTYHPRDMFIAWAHTTKRYYYAFTPSELKKLLMESGFVILKENIDRNITFLCQKLK